ncbi:urease accessory protein UreF [Rhodobacteraceae bacterium NNCM2]|nr:urease accessory protein UreF [Coraliihabitans acroporae]
MTEALLKLHAWLSPGYPVGAYTYSHGLERAVEDGVVTSAPALAAWVEDCLTRGAGRSDAILLAHAWRAPEDDGIAELALALTPSAERLLEAEAQGAAFAQVTGDAWGEPVAPAPYPVAVGRAAAAHRVPLAETLQVYLQAFAANLVSAAVRLVPLGQTEGQRVLAGLSPIIAALAEEAAAAPLDQIGGCAIGADIASMRHETQNVRLFRS